jgi:hypothetical protein
MFRKGQLRLAFFVSKREQGGGHHYHQVRRHHRAQIPRRPEAARPRQPAGARGRHLGPGDAAGAKVDQQLRGWPASQVRRSRQKYRSYSNS